jgi:hypothetical protein
MIVADMIASFHSLRYKYDIRKFDIKVASLFGDAERSVISDAPVAPDRATIIDLIG